MSNKNKLIGLSLIALATLCACNDDNYADGKGNRIVTFSVNAKANGGWSDINGSRSAWMSPQAQQMGEPVEMEGKLNGKTVYLTSEVTEGFPTDNPTFTRGTQITNADGMSSFGVTAFMGSQKYMDHVEIKKSADSWKPQTDYFWLNGKSLDFYAWYPYNSAEGTNGIPSGMTLKQENFSSISYTVPTDVSKQEDLMFAVNKNASEPKDGKATSLDFKHSLAAVKFVVGDLPTGVTVKSIKLKNIAKNGSYSLASDEWTVDLGADNLGDFSVLENGSAIKDNIFPSDGGVAFLIPQSLDRAQENADKKPSVEVVLNDGTNDEPLTAALQVTGTDNKWKAGNTYTYSFSYKNDFELELVKDVFVASGNDAVVYVKANKGWTAELVEDNDKAVGDMIEFDEGQSGFSDGTGNNEQAKLVFKTNHFSTLETLKKEVKVKFTPTGVGGIPIVKTITFWKGLEAPVNSGTYYEVHNADTKTLLQISNGEGCPQGFALPKDNVASVISHLETSSRIAYDKSYPVLDDANNNGTNAVTYKLSYITGQVAGGGGNSGTWHPLYAKAKYPYYESGNKKESEKLDIGTLQVQMTQTWWNFEGIFIFTYNNADNLLKNNCYIGVRCHNSQYSLLFDCYNTATPDYVWLLWSVLNFEEEVNHTQLAHGEGIVPNSSSWKSKYDKNNAIGRFFNLTGKNIISPQLKTYYVRELTEVK